MTRPHSTVRQVLLRGGREPTLEDLHEAIRFFYAMNDAYPRLTVLSELRTEMCAVRVGEQNALESFSCTESGN